MAIRIKNAPASQSTRHGRVGTLLIFLFVLSLSGQTSVKSTTARSFLDSLGVNVHVEYTDGKYANVVQVLEDLKYLGITHVRDAVPRPGTWKPPGQGVAAMRSLAAAGIKFDIVVGDPDLQTDLAQLTSLETYHAGMLSAVEGPNEINNWPIKYGGANGETAAKKFQSDLYKAIHGSTLLNRLPVFYMTGAAAVSLQRDNGMADSINIHPYPQNGDPPGEIIRQAFSLAYPGATIGRVVTETGYYTQPESRVWGGVGGFAQAKGTLAAYFEAANQGSSATYIYQLLDAYVDPSGKNNDYHFGLFEYDTVAKPAAIAVHNLTKFLADTASLPRTLTFALDNLPVSGRSLLLSKSDGSFVIAAWNAVPFWDERKKAAIDSAPIKAHLSLAKPADVDIFDPLTGYKDSLFTGTNFTVEIPDHPVLISVKEPHSSGAEESR